MKNVKKGTETFADLPVGVVANAELLDLPSKRPAYLETIQDEVGNLIKPVCNYSETLLMLLRSPNIASKIWVYSQYDHEVGIRTVIKPGSDASVLRLDNGRFLSAKIDGSPKHCYIDPRMGAIGCFEEACRNVVCTGATPIGMLDHLQFGDPNDPEIFWTFLETVQGLTDFANHLQIPCIGGKVSLYNETPSGPIKPTPVIGVLGLIDKKLFVPQNAVAGDCLVVIGDTRDELGGSEFFEYVHKFVGGRCPVVNFEDSKRNMDCVLDVINSAPVSLVHDCAKGGLAVAISEICMTSQVGCSVSLDSVPGDDLDADRVLFSESHSRYLVVFKEDVMAQITDILERYKVPYGIIGKFGNDSSIEFVKNNTSLINLDVKTTRQSWLDALPSLLSYSGSD